MIKAHAVEEIIRVAEKELDVRVNGDLLDIHVEDINRWVAFAEFAQQHVVLGQSLEKAGFPNRTPEETAKVDGFHIPRIIEGNLGSDIMVMDSEDPYLYFERMAHEIGHAVEQQHQKRDPYVAWRTKQYARHVGEVMDGYRQIRNRLPAVELLKELPVSPDGDLGSRTPDRQEVVIDTIEMTQIIHGQMTPPEPAEDIAKSSLQIAGIRQSMIDHLRKAEKPYRTVRKHLPWSEIREGWAVFFAYHVMEGLVKERIRYEHSGTNPERLLHLAREGSPVALAIPYVEQHLLRKREWLVREDAYGTGFRKFMKEPERAKELAGIK